MKHDVTVTVNEFTWTAASYGELAEAEPEELWRSMATRTPPSPTSSHSLGSRPRT